MYEVILTRLLSVICWYFLAFVSVSTAMFGMTAGALLIQLRPKFFSEETLPRRLYQSVLGAAISMPLALLILLAIPLGVSESIETAVSFLLFSGVIAVPFFFSGIAVCISLTRMPYPTGRIYFVDLAGAALGCLAAIGLLDLIDAPSAIFATSALLFVSAAAYARHARASRSSGNCMIAACILTAVAGLNASTLHGIQPIWAKDALDKRSNIFTEVWNPISKVRVEQSLVGKPEMWGPSLKMPDYEVEGMHLDIDNFAGTEMYRFQGDLAPLSFLNYDVTSLGAQLRRGGSAAIIGVGGGRDVLSCALNGFTRIVGIELNSAMVDLTSRRLDWYSGFSKIPGFELHNSEGRSFLARSDEQFDLIQASLVDTFAATAAGAMALSENSLYTVDGWRVFYEHLKPGGIITFSRWYSDGPTINEGNRLFSLGYATLLTEGVSDPASHMALIQSRSVATLLVSNRPFNSTDIAALNAIDAKMSFIPLVIPGQPIDEPELRRIAQLHTVEEMTSLENEFGQDYSPTFDSSPYFFNAVHIRSLPRFIANSKGRTSNLQATLFLFAFFLAAVLLVIATIALPAWIAYRKQDRATSVPLGSIVYFASIGLGFMCIEMAMIQQLSIFLGHPVYAMVVVLGGLILSTGVGSLLSDSWPARSNWQCRLPPVAGALLILLYLCLVLPLIHTWTPAPMGQRALLSLLLICPPGLAMGFSFPIGLRWMIGLSQKHNLPWMWAINGAAGTLGSFVATLISMETSIRICVLTGAALYLLAALSLPRKATAVVPASLETV